MTVRAQYSDGTDRDVTSLAVFLTNNDVSAADHARRPGHRRRPRRGVRDGPVRDAHRRLAVASCCPRACKFTSPDEPEATTSTSWSTTSSRSCGSLPSGICDDEAFLRRVVLDIVGLPPTVEEYKPLHGRRPTRPSGPSWSTSCSSARSSPRSGSMKWAELLQIRTDPNAASATRRCSSITTGWSTSSRRTCRWTRWSRSCSAPAAARSRTRRPTSTRSTNDTLPLTENVAQVFMGMRVQCAQCHNHPFDRWTQNDYYSFAAFFAQIGRKQGEDYRETIVFNSGGGEVNHPVGGRVMPPKFLGGDVARRRAARTAAWCWPSGWPRPRTRGSPPAFANRVWAHFMGVGIVEPVDDFRVSNPPSNPELLEALGKQFTEYQVRPQGPGPRHLQLADLPAAPRSATRATRATSGTSPTPSSAGSRPRTCSTRSARSPTPRTSSRACRWAPGPCRSPTAARSTYFLTTFGRAHPRDRLLVRGQDGADALAGPPPAQRRHGQRQDPRRASVAATAARSQEDARGGRSRRFTSAASPASRRPEELAKARSRDRRQSRTAERRSKTSSGRCSIA